MYNEILLEHNNYPEFQGKLIGADVVKKTLVNSSCGDELTIYLRVKNGVILDGRFLGRGCAISKASADLMIGAVRGKKITEVDDLKKQVFGLLSGKKANLGEISAISEVSRMPARVKCAKLPWGMFDN